MRMAGESSITEWSGTAHFSLTPVVDGTAPQRKKSTDEIPDGCCISLCNLAVWRFGERRGFTRQKTGEDPENGSHDAERFVQA